MLVIPVLAISVLLQFSAALFAFRLVKVIGKTYSWILISAALFLMGVRRLIPLYHLIFIPENTAPDLIDGIIGLILSFLMFFGVMKIRPLFTERKRVEEALRESEERYRTTMMSIGDGVITTDTEGRVELLNPVTEVLTGWRQEEARGKQLEEVFRIINEETRQTVENPVRRVMREGMVVGLANHTVLISKDGKEHPIDDSGAPIRNEKGEITGVVLVFRDQTRERYAQKALRESESKFRRLFDSNVIGIIFWDTAGNIIGANDGFLQIVGYSKDELLSGKIRWKDMTPPEYAPLDEKAIKEMVATGISTPFEKEYIRKDGNRVPILLCAAMLEGSKDTGICFILDITERKRAEDALRESERKFHETVINLDEGFYSVTLDGLLLEHNQAFNRIMGFDKIADLKGTHVPDFWQNPDERHEYLQALIANGSISNYQINAKTKTGEKITVIASAHFVKDKDNRPLKIEGVFLDITERIRAEESLKRHSERLQNMHRIDQAILHIIESPEGIIQTALQHIRSLLSCQRASIGIFDFKNEIVRVLAANIEGEAIMHAGKNLSLEAFGDLEILRQNRMEAVEDITMISSPTEELCILQSEGIRSCINVPLISGGKLVGVMNLGWKNPRTITAEEKEIAGEVAGQITIAIEQARLLQETKSYATELEERVRERTAQLEASNKELEAFTYSVSHDLRAPLRHINGYVDLLTERFQNSIPEKGIHYLNTIADSARQMAVLIDNLLQFSRTGRQEMWQADLDMNNILQEVLETIKHDAIGRSIEWITSTLPHVYGDQALLRLVWFNLLGNAVKFTRAKEKAVIDIGFKEEDKECVFFVRDNGAGFDMQYAHKLFGVFQRLHSSEEFEGTGIGLANVRRIILKHGGRTWAEGELDKGAVFYFTLPKNKENKP